MKKILFALILITLVFGCVETAVTGEALKATDVGGGIQESGANQQVIHEDGLLSHRRITTTKDRGARGVIGSFHATSVDELEALTVTQGTVLDSAFSDRLGLVSLDHLAAEQLQISSILRTSSYGTIRITSRELELGVRVNRTNGSRASVVSRRSHNRSSHFLKRVD